MIEPMRGDLAIGGQLLARAGFLNTGFSPNMPAESMVVGPSTPIFVRGGAMTARSTELLERMQRISDVERGALMGDPAWVAELGNALTEMTRAITTTTSAFPVRENLEAPARILVPLETPVRNMLPRTRGAGLAVAWRQVTSLGGGYGFLTTVTSGTASATQTVGSTAGMVAGDVLQFTTATTGIPNGGTTVEASLRTISSVTNATTVVLAATITTVTGDVVVNTGKREGDVVTGSTTAARVHGRPMGETPQTGLTAALNTARAFYAEGGCPAEHTTSYASKSATYKQLGTFGSVTGLAMAAGASWGPQLATEKRHALLNLMLDVGLVRQ